MPPLLAVPNVSEGRDARADRRARGAPSPAARALLDRHSDADHNRTVFTLAGEPGGADRGAGRRRRGGDRDDRHAPPTSGAPPGDRRARRLPGRLARPRATATRPATEAVAVADADRRPRRPGLPLRRAGARPRAAPSAPTSATAASPSSGCGWSRGELRAGLRPRRCRTATAGATLVTARPPLAAFNVELDSGDVEVARAVAAGLREAGGGLPGVRAIGLAALQRPRPGLDQRPRPARGPARRGRRAGARAGGAARRPAGRGRAGRPDPAGGARRLPGGRADPRLRPRAAT